MILPILALAALCTPLAHARVAFTTVPNSEEVGRPFKFAWSGGGPDVPVTLKLRSGDNQLDAGLTIASTYEIFDSSSFPPPRLVPRRTPAIPI